MAQSVETTDIFIGAFLLSQGGSLSGVRVKDTENNTVAFMIEGERLEWLSDEYGSGKARVEPVRFRECLNHLRDILFEIVERGARHDRKRENRGGKRR
jgi:hypothetical protein